MTAATYGEIRADSVALLLMALAGGFNGKADHPGRDETTPANAGQESRLATDSTEGMSPDGAWRDDSIVSAVSSLT
ncbi:MAG: hypothetical protein KIT09_28695 [Bryobacteraceae bacterium]|nr:hypothetical protein [Bryobacteraceae bacterium]